MSIPKDRWGWAGRILLSFPAANNFFVAGEDFRYWWQQKSPVVREQLVLVSTRFLLLVVRAIPELTLLFLFVLFPGILPGAIALALANPGIMGV